MLPASASASRVQIIPALFARDAHEFTTQVRAIEPFAPFAHIDIIDGTWLGAAHTWADPYEIGELLSPLQYELHLMVADPLALLTAWESVPAVKRIIVHIEVTPNPRETINVIRFHGWEAVIAINPTTALDAALAYEEYADETMFMGVAPGDTGRPLDERVLSKMKTFAHAAPHAVIGVDGAVTEETLPRFITAGAKRVRVHSALFNNVRLPADAWLRLNMVAQNS